MEPLTGRHILLGVSGGIGAYKAAHLARLLVSSGATVDVVLTRGAQRFVGPATFEGITARPVDTEVWDDVAAGTHVEAGRRADAVAVYPATAHTLARMAAGLADDLLTTTLLASEAPVVVAPAMHTAMWQHQATTHNVQILVERGVHVVGPDDGPLMGHDAGPGRLVEPEAMLDAITRTLDATRPLAGRRVLVTAGGTREPIDPVRFLGNRSSGRMGFALARAAAAAGADVVLIAAPSDLATPPGVQRVDVTTALEMHREVFAHLDGTDIVIKAAAVADFRPDQAAATKLKRSSGTPTIALTENPDILAELAHHRGAATHPLLVGFAAETDDVERHAREKIVRKGADLLVVNDVSRPDAGFEVDTNVVTMLDAAGTWTPLAPGSKDAVARAIVGAVAERVGSDH